MGNPGAFSYSHTLWVKGFLDALGSPHYYSAGSQDVNNRFAASALLYGSPLLVPIPDLKRTELPADGRRQPARLARLGAVRAAGARAARIVERAAAWWWSTRAAPRPRASSSTCPCARTATPGCCSRCSHVIFEEGLADRGFLARCTGAPSELRARCARAIRPRRPRSAPACRRNARAQLARDFAARRRRGGLRPHRLVPGPLRHAGGVPDRRAQRGDRQPRPARAAPSSAARRSRSTTWASRSASTPTGRSARGSAASPT